MNTCKGQQQGFSLIELMLASTIGLVIGVSILGIYLAQSRLYKTSNSQDLIQSSENAIANLVSPILRGAGFTGCGTITSAYSNLNAGGPAPISNINTNPTMVMGYSGGGDFTVTSNPSNSSSATDWTPSLDATLLGQAQKGSDVIVVFGSAPGATPISVTTTIDLASSSFTVQSTTGTTVAANQFGSVSDCVKSIIFQVTGVSATTVTHNAGGAILQNTTNAFPIAFLQGAQFIQMQQTAFFIGQGQGGQSSLMRATLVGNAWTVEQIVPGVEMMRVQYGIGATDTISQYVSANAVTNWSQVHAVRIAFLIAGQPGSGSLTTNQYTLLDSLITVPVDTRLRHVFEITINLRNSIS